MAQPVYQTSPSNSYKFHHSILEYSTQPPLNSHQVNPLPKPHSMSRTDKRTKKVSRLEMMRMDYRQKLLKEKEDKLNAYHTTQQERGRPHKTNSGGTVREFFAERRALEAQENPSTLPPIQAHFNRVRDKKSYPDPSQKKKTLPPQGTLSESRVSSNQNLQRRQPKQAKNHQQPTMPAEIVSNGKKDSRFSSQRNGYRGQKRTKGIDKQDPLPPLQKGSRRGSDKPPTPNKRYETYADLTRQNYNDTNTHMPTPPQEAKPLTRPRAPSHAMGSDVDESESMSVCTDDAPPNLMRLKAKAQLQKQLSLQRMNTNSLPASKQKMTDFQKWQMEQDQAREQRLAQFKSRNRAESVSTEDDHKSSDDLAIREKELLEKIRNEQQRLARLQNERQMLEEQEKQEAKAEEEWTLKLAAQATKTTMREEEISPEPTAIKKPVRQKVKPKKSEVRVEEGSREEPPVENANDVTSFYAQAAIQAEQEEEIGQLSPCTICGRSFASDRLAKHEKVCAKNSKTKRKAFNSAMQRAQGTDHEKYVVSGKYKEEPEKKVGPRFVFSFICLSCCFGLYCVANNLSPTQYTRMNLG